MISKLLLFMVLTLGGAPAFAQCVDTMWVRRYNAPRNSYDKAFAMTIDSSGNVYVTGCSQGGVGISFNYATLKYYPNGDTAWARTYNGTGSQSDIASAIAVDASGNVYVTGESWGAYLDYATIKYDCSGTELWISRYNGVASYHDAAHAITVDSFGNVYVTGITEDDHHYQQYATIKYYPNGDTAWVRIYDDPTNDLDRAEAVTVDDSGNVYVAGSSGTVKYDADGNLLWAAPWGGIDIVVDDVNDVYAVWGNTVVKYNPGGDTAWVRWYDGKSQDLALDAWGNVCVTGWRRGTSTYDDYATAKYAPDGSQLWFQLYQGPVNGYDKAYGIAVDDSGNVYVTGRSVGGCTTVKYDPDGNELWSKKYTGPGTGEDIAHAIAVDDSMHVYVAGYSYGDGSFDDYITIKYRERQHNHPPNSFCLLHPPRKAFTPRKLILKWQSTSDPDPWDQIRYDLFVSLSYYFHPDSTLIDSNVILNECARTLDYGTYYWKVKAKDDCGGETWCNQIGYFMVTGLRALPLGDFNSDGSVDAEDVVFAINYLYRSGPAPSDLKIGDTNCDDVVDLQDLVYLANYLFRNGPLPCGEQEESSVGSKP